MSNATIIISDSFDLLATSDVIGALSQVNLAIFFGAAGILLDVWKVDNRNATDSLIQSLGHMNQDVQKLTAEMNRKYSQLWEEYEFDITLLVNASLSLSRISKAADEAQRLNEKDNLQILCQNNQCLNSLKRILEEDSKGKTMVQMLMSKAPLNGYRYLMEMSSSLLNLIATGNTAIFANSILQDNREDTKRTHDDLQLWFYAAYKDIMKAVTQYKAELHDQVHKTMRYHLGHPSSQSTLYLSRSLTFSLGGKYKGFEFHCAVYHRLKNKDDQTFSGAHLTACVKGYCGVCFMYEVVTHSKFTRAEYVKMLSSFDVDVHQALTDIGSNVQSHPNQKPDFFQQCDFDKHAPDFSAQMNLFDMKDPHCISEFLQHALRNFNHAWLGSSVIANSDRIIRFYHYPYESTYRKVSRENSNGDSMYMVLFDASKRAPHEKTLPTYHEVEQSINTSGIGYWFICFQVILSCLILASFFSCIGYWFIVRRRKCGIKEDGEKKAILEQPAS